MAHIERPEYSISGRFPLHDALWHAGMNYLALGLEGYERLERAQADAVQHLVGNIVIAAELFIKSYLATLNPLLIFDRISEADALALVQGKQVPIDTLVRESVSTITFDRCLKFFVEEQQEFPHELGGPLQTLRQVRNASLHYVLASVETFRIRRCFFGVAKIYQILADRLGRSDQLNPDRRKTIEHIVAEYDTDRNARLEMLVKRARDHRDKHRPPKNPVVSHGPESSYLACPICSAQAFLDYEVEFHHDGVTFMPLRFGCPTCGLILDDWKDMDELGVETLEVGLSIPLPDD